MKNLLIIIMCLAIVVFAVFYAHHQRLISDLETQAALKEAETVRVQSEISDIIKRHEAEKSEWLEKMRNAERSMRNKKQTPQKTPPKKGRVSDAELDIIVRAVCLVESDNRAHIRGDAGERGVMQLQKNEWDFATKKILKNYWDWDGAFDYEKNIKIGSAYIDYLIRKYQNWETAVRVYHSGRHGVLHLGRGERYLAMVRRAIENGNTKWRRSER